MKLLLIILVWLVPLAGMADPELNIALKGGANAATLTQDNRVNRYGFSGGFAGNLQAALTDRFSLAGQLELLYTPRGADVVFDGVTQGRFREHYFDIMVAARPEVQLGPTSLYLLLGGGLNILINANKENIAGSKQDITGDLRRIDVALLGGAGVALHLPRQAIGPFHLGTVFLEARHDIGLVDIDRANGGFKNRTSSLMLGLSLALGSGVTPPGGFGG